jgi:transcriptional regulator with XRE-family HTH domain
MAATSIGHRLRKLRESKDLGQDWLAHELGMSVSGYSRIERDEVKITYDKLERIATILDVPVADILNHQEASQLNNTTTNNNTNNGQSLEIEKLETLYREQINNLREEVAYLRELLRKTMEKK